MNQYLHLHDVGVDSSDNVYVTDKDNCKVEKFTADGNFIRKCGYLVYFSPMSCIT